MMKRVRKIHFWIGIVAMVFLLIQSVTGLTLYFSTDEPQPNNMQQSWDPASQDTGTTDESAAANENASQDESQAVQGKRPGMEDGGPDGMQRPEGMPEMKDSIVKSIHEGVIGLISGIGLLLMSVTGLILAIMMGLNKRKQMKRKNDDKKEKPSL